jgi:uncharacterized membrane protein
VWSASEAWGFAFKVVTKRFSTVALPLAVGVVVQAVLSSIVSQGGAFAVGIGASQGILEPTLIPFIQLAVASIGGMVTVLVSAFMTGGLVTTALKAARGQPTSFADPFSGGRYFGQNLVAAIVVGIVVANGMMLCLVPGIILALGTCFYGMLIVDQNLPGVDAVRRSWDMTKGHKVNLFVFGLLGLCVFAAGALACGIGAILVSVPMGYVAFASVYLRLKGEALPEPT